MTITKSVNETSKMSVPANRAENIARRLIDEHRPNMVKPEVFCIGPEKTGTTWLYINLRHHPQVWTTPIKELRYWAEGYGMPAHTLNNVLFSSHFHYRNLRKALRIKMRRILSRQYQERLFEDKTEWLLKYTFGRRSNEWYSALFPLTPLLCVDVSPIYYALPEERIEQLAAYNPNAKIIFTVRNPIDRVWSLARMYLCEQKARRLDQVAPSEFMEFFTGVHMGWKPYLERIALWQKHFTQVHVGYYDALRDDGADFFRNVCDFLNIKEGILPDIANKPIYQGIPGELPLEFRQVLFEQYSREIKEMADAGTIHAHKWLDEHNEIVKHTSSK